MRVSELFGRAKIEYPREAENIEVTDIVTDSGCAREGSLFICINGLTRDGHEYIGDAVGRGAKVIVAEQVRDVGVGGAAATIYVDNTRQAAALLYNSWYCDPAKDMKLVAVTGTNGKTSVTYILKKIFERAGKRCGLIGTVGCFCADKRLDSKNRNPLANMTTPDPEELYRLLALMRDEGAEFVFIEATSHALALSKLDALTFDTAVFTNLTQDHLDFHGDMEGYFASKARLFGMCRRAVINIDDSWADRFIESARCKEIYTVSANRKADFCAENVKICGAEGSEYALGFGDEKIDIKIPICGRFFVNNSAEAAAVARLYGISHEDIRDALLSLEGVDGRMERVKLGDDAEISVFIDYAHTPDALEKLLKSARDFREAGQRIVLLFGCGGDRDRSKRRQMAHIASRLSDFVIVTSDNSRSESAETIISEILSGIDKEKEYAAIPDRAEAIEYAIANARAGDIILLAGKGHERYEIDRRGKHPFDEREIARAAYYKYKAR
ncbi:MAG: UDP-N-acetylmuramoyl-L-alanyl-D-glutamate--2,6-diaminopimelate ligase [Clostridia bacterium]|nr:UDP-N-acetylmuramoyl-L-alanyl-D-glutamate--2,6-diaminopimelate ligase [Clostridia bacterium]